MRSDFVHESGETLYGNPYFVKSRFGWSIFVLGKTDQAKEYFKLMYRLGKVFVTDNEEVLVPRYLDKGVEDKQQ